MRQRIYNKAAILLALASAATTAHASAAPQVVATIAPIHALVAGVMAGVGTPTLLLPPTASPHSFALKPSAAKDLDNADIVFWIGDELETFMARPLRALASDARIVGLADTQGMTLLSVRAPGSFADHDAEEHQHAGHDPHIWLSPTNAQHIVDAIVATLVRADSANTALYRRNADHLRARIEGLSAQISAQLTPLHRQPYIIFHDAYQYFEREFDLQPAGSITLDPGQPAGAGRLAELIDRVAELEVRCLFSEPQFKPDIVNALLVDPAIRVGELDSLGSKFTPGPDHYFDMMRDMATSFADCLTPPK